MKCLEFDCYYSFVQLHSYYAIDIKPYDNKSVVKICENIYGLIKKYDGKFTKQYKTAYDSKKCKGMKMQLRLMFYMLEQILDNEEFCKKLNSEAKNHIFLNKNLLILYWFQEGQVKQYIEKKLKNACNVKINNCGTASTIEKEMMKLVYAAKMIKKYRPQEEVNNNSHIILIAEEGNEVLIEEGNQGSPPTKNQKDQEEPTFFESVIALAVMGCAIYILYYIGRGACSLIGNLVFSEQNNEMLR